MSENSWSPSQPRNSRVVGSPGQQRVTKPASPSQQRNVIQIRGPSYQVEAQLRNLAAGRGRILVRKEDRNEGLNLMKTLELSIEKLHNPETLEEGLKEINSYSVRADVKTQIWANNAVEILEDKAKSEEGAASAIALLTLSNLFSVPLTKPANPGQLDQSVSSLVRSLCLIVARKHTHPIPELVSEYRAALSLCINITYEDLFAESFVSSKLIHHLVRNLSEISEDDAIETLKIVQNMQNDKSFISYLFEENGLVDLVNGVYPKHRDSNEINDMVTSLLAKYSYDDECAIKFYQSGAVNYMIDIISNEEVSEKLENSLRSLANLSVHTELVEEMNQYEIVPRIAKYMTSDQISYIELSTTLFINLSRFPSIVEEMIENEEFVNGISTLCKSLNENIMTQGAKLASNVAMTNEGRKKLLEISILESLKSKSFCSNPRLSHFCTMAVSQITAPIGSGTVSGGISGGKSGGSAGVSAAPLPRHKHTCADLSDLPSHTLRNEKTLKNLVHRRHVIQEILDTEKTYVEVLLTIIKVYYDPLVQMTQNGKGLVKDADIKVMFGSIDIICKMHTQFLSALEKLLKAASTDAELSIGESFINLANCLRLYRAYISNYDQGITLMCEYLEKPKFANWAQEQMDKFQTLKLSSLMITPIQRIPRYVLLLKDLIKHMPEDHPDFSSVNNALDRVLEVAEYLDKERGKADGVRMVVVIQEKLSGFDSLVHPSRQFVKEGQVMVRDNDSSEWHKRQLILFSDIVLICEVTKNEKYKLKHNISLLELKVLDVPKEDSYEFVFRLLFRENYLTVAANNKEEKDSLVEELNSTIYTIKKRTFVRSKAQLNEERNSVRT